MVTPNALVTPSVQADRLPGSVGDLERAGRGSGDQAEPRIGIDERRQIGEAFVLVARSRGSGCSWMIEFSRPSLVCRYRPVKKYWTPGKQSALGSALVPGAGVIVGQVLPNVPPYWIVGVIVPLTAAVNADLAAIVENIGAGRDVDQPHRPQAIFGRERADHQAEAADPAGVENAAEAGRAVGQHHAIDAELQIGVIVADVEEAAGGGVLRDAGELQQDLLDRRVVAAGKRVDRGSWVRVVDAVPMVVKRLLRA